MNHPRRHKWFLFVNLLLIGCSSTASTPLKFELRTYRFCTKEEVDYPTGKLCYRYCAKRSRVLKRCKEMHLEVIDLADPYNHSKFLNAGFKVRRFSHAK